MVGKMIDAHCHLEQKDYDDDRDEVVNQLKKELKAVITVCTHPKDFEKTMHIIEKYKGFAFATCAIHPEYIKETSEKQIEEFFDLLYENKDKLVGIGETGLDYFWVKEKEWQEKQKEMFLQFIEFSKEIRKPLVIHSREAYEDVIKVLETQDVKDVLLHMWGDKNFISKINDNGWNVTIGPIIQRSKNHKRIARDIPLEHIMLETDSPWFGNNGRGLPINIKKVAEKIAEVKKLPFEIVWKTCGENAIKFFNLNL